MSDLLETASEIIADVPAHCRDCGMLALRAAVLAHLVKEGKAELEASRIYLANDTYTQCRDVPTGLGFAACAYEPMSTTE